MSENQPTHLDLFSGIQPADLPLLPDGPDSAPSASVKSSPTPSACSQRTSTQFWPTPQAEMPGCGENNSKVQNLLTGSRHSFYLTQAVAAEELQPGIITRPSLVTSEPSTAPSSPESVSSQGDFLASHSAAPGSEEARKMTVISGRRCSALSTKQDPLGCLERTLLASSTWNSTL